MTIVFSLPTHNSVEASIRASPYIIGGIVRATIGSCRTGIAKGPVATGLPKYLLAGSDTFRQHMEHFEKFVTKILATVYEVNHNAIVIESQNTSSWWRTWETY